MSILRGDASEIYQLAAEFAATSAKAVPLTRAAVAEGAKVVEAAWRNDAARLHDSHAKYYPDSIDSELVFSIGSVSADIGPNVDKKQGFLGRILEDGGEHSPAYLTGQKALDRSSGAIERALTNRLDGLF